MSEKQSKIDSAMEVVTNTAIGFSIAMVGNHIILPITYGVHTSMAANFWTAVGFTAISMARQWTIRRAFNGRSVWTAIKSRFVCPHGEFTDEEYWWDRRCVRCGNPPEYNGAH